ncbi:PE-PGRS family protein [Anaeromyxobacter sp. Fw109-5]|nr:PE-PGRS family protein [Anaeromyxobacter sp. Fw109-5]
MAPCAHAWRIHRPAPGGGRRLRPPRRGRRHALGDRLGPGGPRGWAAPHGERLPRRAADRGHAARGGARARRHRLRARGAAARRAPRGGELRAVARRRGRDRPGGRAPGRGDRRGARRGERAGGHPRGRARGEWRGSRPVPARRQPHARRRGDGNAASGGHDPPDHRNGPRGRGRQRLPVLMGARAPPARRTPGTTAAAPEGGRGAAHAEGGGYESRPPRRRNAGMSYWSSSSGL